MPGPLLALSRKENNKVTILELDEIERELATIRVRGKRPFGLTFRGKDRYLYAACWISGTIVAINLDSLKTEKSLAVARLPAWATPRPGAEEIWISNEGAGVVSILDTNEWGLSAEIVTGGGPSDIAFTTNGRHAWVTNERDDNISFIDASVRRKICDIPVGNVPQGIAVVHGESQLLVANFGSSSVSVVDIAARKEIEQIAVGRGPIDVVTLVQQELETAWVTCFSEGAVSVISIKRGEEIQRIVTGGRPQGLEVHPDESRIYATVGELDELIVLSSNLPCSILRRMKMRGGPARMTIATNLPFSAK